MNVTKMDIRSEVRRLQDAGYNVPRDTDPDRLVDVWASFLGGFASEDVTAAVNSYIEDAKHYWPKPGEILQRARGASEDEHGQRADNSPRGEYMRWEQSHEGPCPVCGAMLQLHRGRYHILHNATDHRRRGIPHVGLPMSREDEQMYREYGSWKERRKKEREKAARSKAASMKANAHNEPTESEKRAKQAAHQYVESHPSRECRQRCPDAMNDPVEPALTNP